MLNFYTISVQNSQWRKFDSCGGMKEKFLILNIFKSLIGIYKSSLRGKMWLKKYDFFERKREKGVKWGKKWKRKNKEGKGK